MPILIIYGIPTETNEEDLNIVCELMRQRIASVRELKIEKEQVSVFFPKDLMSKGLGEEIIIFVEGLKESPERTENVKRMLIYHLIDGAHCLFPKATLIECIIKPYVMAGFGKESDNCFFSDIR
ncbi:MAG TPA: hypothetical protein PK142_02720 [bacterium]|nr:hypothetical protein [bacterium]